MAERRMFSKKIVDSDEFLDMPCSAQALYFHLGMRADDDGFVNNPKKITKFIGASIDDLKLLIDRKYITGFDNGIIVINHWKVNNFIRKDRYRTTMFYEEKRQLSCDENGTYIEQDHFKDKADLSKEAESFWSTNGQPVVNQWSTEYSIGKDSLVKESIVKESIVKERIDKDSLVEESIVKERIDKDSLDEGRGVENRDVSLTAATATARNENEEYFSFYDDCEDDRGEYDSTATTTKEKRADASFDADMTSGNLNNANENVCEKVKVGDALDRSDSKRLRARFSDKYKCAIVLSDEQYDDLKSRLGASELDRYMEKLSSFIVNKGARIKSHYDTILKWYEEDSRVSPAPPKPKPAPEKYRYGSFDHMDAFNAALKRTYGDDYERLKPEKGELF